jgi:hypothetical protein
MRVKQQSYDDGSAPARRWIRRALIRLVRKSMLYCYSSRLYIVVADCPTHCREQRRRDPFARICAPIAHRTERLGNLSWKICQHYHPSLTRFQTYQVPRRHPSSLFHHPLRILINFRRSLRNFLHRNLIPPSRTLNISQCLLPTPQLNLDLALRLLGIPHRHLFESLDLPDLLGHIICLGLEALEVLLNLVDDSCVLEQGAIVAEVDSGGLIGQDLDPAAGVIVALLEVRERGCGGAAEGELGWELGPVEFGCGSGLGSVS